MNDPQDMFAAYFEGTLNAEQVADLEAWLREDRARAMALVRQAMLDCHLVELLREQNLEHIASDTSHDSQFGALLAALDAPEDGIPLVKIAEEPKPARPAKSHQAVANPISTHDLAAVTVYLLRQAITSKPAILAYAAAIALLAAVLLIPRGNTPTTPTAQHPPAATQPTTPTTVPTAAPVVATLTATHNARWVGITSAAPAVGDRLTAQQRLTLTQGFAEITTNRGAVAVLEAPATIELLDNDNSIKLIAGKLVGTCETESSKGFFVQTPHMDIIDLGTQFGVVTDRAMTELHVIKGEVQTCHINAPLSTPPMNLVAGQSARALADADTVAAIEYHPERFAAVIPVTLDLPGTGRGLSAGDVDSSWQIVAIDGTTLDQPQALSVTQHETYEQFLPNDPATCQWLGWLPNAEIEPNGYITYTFQTQLELPADLDPASSRLQVRFIADNAVSAVIVNGQRIEIQDPEPTTDYGTWIELSISEHLVAGTNTIGFDVRNYNQQNPEKGNQFNNGGHVGLRLDWQLESETLFTPQTKGQ